jgi:hypothetical protein
MSTVILPRGRTVADAVARARLTIYIARLTLGIVAWVVLAGAVWLILFGLDNLLRLPGAVRFPLAVAGVVVTLAGLWKNVVRVALDRRTPVQIAALLEQKYGIGKNVLVNSLQFGEGEYGERQRPFIQETISAGTLGLAAVSLRDLWQPLRLGKWGLVLIAILALWIGYAVLAPRYARNALDRYLYALADVPPVGSVELTVVPDTDIDIAEREDVRVTVEVTGVEPGEKLSSYPELFWQEGALAVEPQPGGATRVVMQPVVGRSNVYAHTFPGVRRSFAFRVFARDSYSRSTKVTVHPAPRIAEAQFRLTPPAYVGAPTTTLMGPPHPVSGLPGSTLGIDIKLTQAAQGLRWRAQGDIIDFREQAGQWRAQTTIKAAGPYEVEVQGVGLSTWVPVASGVMSLLADRPPQIEFVQSAMSWTVLPGERVPLRLRTEDDHGLKSITVTVKSAFGGSPPATVKSWVYGKAPGKKGSTEETMDLTIDAARFAPGGKYLVEAVATDFCPGNPAGVSRPVLIEVKALDKLEMPGDPKLADVYGALDKAIAQQKRALDATRTLSSHLEEVWLNLSGQPRPAEEVRKLQDAHRNQILGSQRDVRTTLQSVQGKTAGETKQVVRRMLQLAEGEAVQANDRAFTVTLPALSAGSHQPARDGLRVAAVPERQKVAFPPTRARYVAIAVPTTHGWQDKMLVQDLALLTAEGKEIASGKDGPPWVVVSAGPGDKSAENLPHDRRWQPAGRAPYYLVLDLGKEHLLNGLALTSVPVEGSLGPRDLRVYLGADKAPAFILSEPTREQLAAELRPLERIQEAIYNELVALKGQEARKVEKEKEEKGKKALGEGLEAAPSVTQKIKKFGAELKDWTKEHERNAERRKAIMDRPAQDFTDKDVEELGQLNLEKKKQARKLEDMVMDLVNSTAMDFGDPRAAKTLPNLVDKALYLKDLENLAATKADETDYTYNLDTAVTSQAKEIVKGTEDTTHVEPTPGSGESPEDMKNLPYLQELPTELAVTVPPLKQNFDELYEKIKQAGLSLANSVDDTEGPIGPSTFSGTSAAGKMGDAPPDKKFDRTGRSNVGRTGKSDGQMVGDTAPPIPDDVVGIPERMSNSPQEGGKDVDDKSGTDATSQGLGKSTNGLTEFGRSGKLPPGMDRKLKQILKQAEDVRTSAQDLVMKLQRHRLPTADLKMALQRLEQVKQALRKGDGIGVRQAYSDAVRHLQATQKGIVEQIDRRRAEQAKALGRERELSGRDAEADPRGYEEIIGAYFRQIAERK